jgi:pimeloyl-ACP methyl ester carboxylesterase
MSELRTIAVADGLAARALPGPGPKVLWLHGYTLDSTSWREMWRRIPGYQHIGLDLPAHGASGPIGPGENLVSLARKIAAFCRAEDVRLLVALSFGTLTATQVAIEEPDWFRSIVLGAPSLAGGPQDPRVGMTYARLGELYHRVGPGPLMTQTWMDCIAWKGVEKQPELEREMRALVERHRWSELADWGMWRLLQPPQDEAALRRVSAPVLVMIGELDLPAFHEVADTLARALPHSHRVTLPGIGHLCMLEAPDLCAGPVREHLESPPVRAAASGSEAGTP